MYRLLSDLIYFYIGNCKLFKINFPHISQSCFGILTLKFGTSIWICLDVRTSLWCSLRYWLEIFCIWIYLDVTQRVWLLLLVWHTFTYIIALWKISFPDFTLLSFEIQVLAANLALGSWIKVHSSLLNIQSE